MSTRPDSIDPEIAREYLEAADIVFIDARPKEELERSGEKIPGAIPIDPGAGAEMDAVLETLPREKLFVAYCDEPGEATAAQVARRARELGIQGASVLAGGFRAWKDAGFPTEPLPRKLDELPLA